jgi:hypothetical protein
MRTSLASGRAARGRDNGKKLNHCERFVLFKHRLMLSAAATALLSGAAAHADTTISDARTTGVKTSTIKTGGDNIIIATGGSITVSATGAVATIDSNNSITNDGTISNKNHDGAAGILIDATGKGAAGLTGTLTNAGTIDLTGTGQSKNGIVLQGGKFTGDIIMTSVSNLVTQGDVSNGILIAPKAKLIGDLNLAGSITMNQSTAASTVNSSLIGVNIAGRVSGDVLLSGVTSVIGAGARGLVVATGGSVGGTIENIATISTAGIITPSTKVANPEAGSVFVISGNVKGGFYNAGPTSATDTTTPGVITMLGTGSVIQVGSDAQNVTLGAVPTTIDATNKAGYSFINRGTLIGGTTDANVQASLIGIQIGGSTAFKTTLAGGFLNTGAVSVNETSTSGGILPAGPSATVAVLIGANAVVPKFTNLAFLDGSGNPVTTSGNIISTFSGVSGGATTAIAIASGANPGGTMELDNLNGARISANGTTTDPSIASIAAIAINDQSGTLTRIVNAGTIQAVTTHLDNDAQIATAIDTRHNTTGVRIIDGDNNIAGTIVGDVYTGSGADRIVVTGTSTAISSISGDVFFGSAGNTVPADNDFLNMPAYGHLTGALVSADGYLRVQVGANSILSIDNTTLATPVSTQVTGFDVSALGELDVTISDNLNAGVVKASDHITLASGALFNVKFGSFINNTNSFVLLDAPNGGLTLPDAIDYHNKFTTPFLFTGGICTHNVSVAQGGDPSIDCGAGITTTRSQLILTLNQKTADQLHLTGYAQQLYSIVNQVLPFDDALGGAVVSGVNSEADAQAVFDSFAPSVTGGSRAILVSLTDQATGPVGARQRLLRTYGKQAGESTLWGVEFAQFLKDPGETIGANGGAAGLLPGYKDHGFGFAIGADGGSASGGWYGGALTFFTGDIGELGNRHGQTQSEWYMLSGYTDWRGRGLFLDTNLGGGVAQFKTKRIIDIDTDPTAGVTLYSRTATSKHIGVYVQGSATTGVILNYGGTVITPQVSLDGFMLRENGYSETGGGGPTGDGFDLDVGASYSNSLRGFSGVDLRQDIDVGSFLLQPEARVGYRYDFLAKPQKVTANFVALPGTGFTVAGPDPSSGNLVAGATIAASTDTWSIGVSYDFVHGTNGVNQQSGMFTLLGRI